MEERRKGFYDLTNLLRRFKGPVTYTEVTKAVCEEGWVADFLRLGYNTINRQINRHNAKYNGTQYPYKEDSKGIY